MTSIRDFGGEFALISEITKRGGAVVGVGDDAAVIDYKDDRYLLATVDMLCDGDHFRREWASPYQIGAKAMQVNVSDIAAMGGVPKYALVSLSLTDDVDVEFMQSLYKGMNDVADDAGFQIIGGDTTHSSNMTISVTLLGEVEKDLLRLRSDAKAGQLICVTGDLGKSSAGLNLLMKGVTGSVKDHLEPKARLSWARSLAPHAGALIDVSDGLASEVNHICDESGVGAYIDCENIPISGSTMESAKALGADPLKWALSGGEDFELVYTIDREKIKEIPKEVKYSVVGEVKEAAFGRKMNVGGQIRDLAGGFDHFSP